MNFSEYVAKRDAELDEALGRYAGQALGTAAGSMFGGWGAIPGAMIGR